MMKKLYSFSDIRRVFSKAYLNDQTCPMKVVELMTLYEKNKHGGPDFPLNATKIIYITPEDGEWHDLIIRNDYLKEAIDEAEKDFVVTKEMKRELRDAEKAYHDYHSALKGICAMSKSAGG